MQVELVHVSASGRVEPKTLGRGEHVLGREAGCAIRVPSSEVSRRHCVFKVSGEGARVRDLGSSNGTWVNAERVRERRLASGDLVAVGPLVFVIRIDGEPETIDPVLLFEQGRPRAESTPGVDAAASAGGSEPGGMSPLVEDPEGSSIIEFDFDLSDDEDDQPPL
jgi:pSer/pThr/pTyr-binding forkhead associated (FHA) protein